MKLFITKKKLINELASELAYLQIRADWWFYISNCKTKQDMSSMMLDNVAEVKTIACSLGILNEVYEKAYEIYDFRDSGKKDFIPNIELIKQLDREFCDPRKYKRVTF